MVYTESPKEKIHRVIVQAAVCCGAAFRACHYCAMLVSRMLAIIGMFKLHMRVVKLSDWYWLFILEQDAYLHPKHQGWFSYSHFQWDWFWQPEWQQDGTEMPSHYADQILSVHAHCFFCLKIRDRVFRLRYAQTCLVILNHCWLGLLDAVHW